MALIPSAGVIALVKVVLKIALAAALVVVVVVEDDKLLEISPIYRKTGSKAPSFRTAFSNSTILSATILDKYDIIH